MKRKRKLKALHILMADDDTDDQLLFKEAFIETNVEGELQFVQDGDELLMYLRRQGKFRDLELFPEPNLILLDLNMPRKDGREALQEIKADPVLKKIPVVIMTTSMEEDDIHWSYEMGASSFITKPMSFDGLVKVMSSVCRYWLSIAELPHARN